MLPAWRIVKAGRSETAFSGEGAAKFGGRWNSRGVPIIYCSSSAALATLELLVHINPQIILDYVLFRIELPPNDLEELPPQKWPADWRLQPAPLSTRQVGDAWIREAKTLALSVPSVIIPGERNYLLNPLHPGFKKLNIGKPEKFSLDPRLKTTDGKRKN